MNFQRSTLPSTDGIQRHTINLSICLLCPKVLLVNQPAPHPVVIADMVAITQREELGVTGFRRGNASSSTRIA